MTPTARRSRNVIAAKHEGRRLEPAEEAEPAGQVVDLMTALQQSVRSARASRGKAEDDASVHALGPRTEKKPPAEKAAKKTAAKKTTGKENARTA
ncbi:hypothetical protein [Streptomyces sp. KLOTTS4A1]|uniref:hypothetical protein n=1 Tax=Streptomyces sp. KLOTTS4A1 TaxID=3390996 RepID=UPI0039F49407